MGTRTAKTLRFRTDKSYWPPHRAEALEAKLAAAIDDKALPFRHRYFLRQVLRYIASLKVGKRDYPPIVIAAWVRDLMRVEPSKEQAISKLAEKLGISRTGIYKLLDEVDAKQVEFDPDDTWP